MFGRARQVYLDARGEPMGYGRWVANLRMATGGLILSRLAGFGDANYAIRAIYFEYQNLSSPGPADPGPDPARGDTVDHFLDLDGTADRDYVRVFLDISPKVEIRSGDEAYFEDGQGNNLRFFARTAATVGALGKPFTSAAGSTICGLAFVATPVPSDPTRDVLFARITLDTPDQVARPAVGQVAFEYVLPL